MEGDPKGKWTFRPPRYADEAKNDRVAQKLHDMTQPWRNSEIERGGEMNAAIENVTLRDRGGSAVTVPAAHAEAAARARGLRPFVRYGGIKVLTDSEGYLWRDYGRPPLEPVGHTHLGKPWPHQRATCRGCRAGTP